jgi:hypothetical protein
LSGRERGLTGIASGPSTIPGMNAAMRRTLGWTAAVLLNVGALLFVVGLIVPRAGGGVSVLAVGIGVLLAGLAAGAGWLATSRTRP